MAGCIPRREAMAEETVEVLVLTDYEGNVYALPRRLLERTRVPEELKSAIGILGRNRGPFWHRLNPTGTTPTPPTLASLTSPPRLPWTVGWFRVPSA